MNRRYTSGWCVTGEHEPCAGRYANADCTCPCHEGTADVLNLNGTARAAARKSLRATAPSLLFGVSPRSLR